MLIKPRRILLMDIGNKAHTEYKYDKEVMMFMMKNNLNTCSHGHIHSHNTFGVFFSGEDDGELNANCTTHNYYLSLIVNNALDMIAKVVYVATPHIFLCPDEDGVQYPMPVEGLNKVMMVHDCDINVPGFEIEVGDEFQSRLEEIKKRTAEANAAKAAQAKIEADKKAAEAKAKAATTTAPNTPGKLHDPAAVTKAQKAQALQKENNGANQGISRGGVPNQSLSVVKTPSEWQGSEDITHNSLPTENTFYEYDDFLCYVLRDGEEKKADEISKALFQANIDHNTTGVKINTILGNYVTYYDNYYLVEEKGLDAEHFMEVLEDFIDVCENYVADYTWLASLSSALRELGNKFEQSPLVTKID